MIGYGPNKGIVPITCEELFKAIEENRDDKKQLRVGRTDSICSYLGILRIKIYVFLMFHKNVCSGISSKLSI